MNVLAGKTALVTGAGRDIGREMAISLAAEGAHVLVGYHSSADAARATVEEVHRIGGKAAAFRSDVMTEVGCATLAMQAGELFGGTLDILVNNAGGLVGRRSLQNMTPDFVEEVMRLNFTSTVLMTRAALALIPDGGCIINMASLAGRNGGAPGASIYAAAKAAVMTFTRGLAKELGPRQIRVNCLCPGMIDTTFHDMFSTDDERVRTHGMTPLRREGTAAEVAATTVFLASPASSFMTGVSLDVNGGLGFS